MKSLKRIMAVTLSATMAAGMIVGPVNTVYAAGNVEKEETVYVNQTATGDINSITVSDWLKNVSGTGEIKDKSTLSDIKNVKGNEQFTENNGNLIWKANDTDIYYQGTTKEKPPVGVEISYKLDGKAVSTDELVGKSGNVEITLKYINNTSYEDEIDGVKTSLKSPFLMASAIILPVDNFSNVEVSQGKIVSEGSNQILVAYGMPGLFDSLKLANDTREKLEDSLSDTVTIKAKVTDFELASIYTVATSDELTNVELDENSDMDDLEDALDELDDASEKLVSGTSDLSDGVKTLQDKFKEYASGVSKVSNGASDLSDGAGKLSTGIKKYTDGVKTVTDGASDYIKGTGSLTAGVKAYVAGEKQIEDGAKKLYDGSKSFPEQYGTFSTGLDSYVAGVDSAAAGAETLKKGTAQISEGVDKLVSESKAGAAALAEGAEQIQTGVAGLQQNSAYYSNAIEALKGIDKSTLSDADQQALAAAITALETGYANETGVLSQLNSGINGENGLVAGTKGMKAKLESDQIKALVSGAADAATGMSSLSTGLSTLSSANKGKELKDGSSKISAGLTSVISGISDLYNGIKTLSKNNNALTTGADTLEKSGTLLTNGIGQLTSNTKTLTSSAGKLSKGAKSLSNGLSSIDTATGKVTDGIGELSDGTVKLKDGMSEFKSQGTDKLKNEYNDKVKTVLDRLDSLTGEAGQYNSFSGLADGMNGKVKFIFQTEEIKNEK